MGDAANEPPAEGAAIVLVPARGAEIEAVRSGARRVGALVVPAGELDPPEVLVILAKLYHELEAEPGWGAWMIAFKGTLAGFCSLTAAPRERTCEIGYSVFDGLRGRGVATAAVAHMLTEIRDRGFAHVRAETTRDNAASQRALAKNGFACVGERFDPEDGDILIWQRDV